jgi:hypothetical protein
MIEWALLGRESEYKVKSEERCLDKVLIGL